ncbi:hypothetical protein GN956_G18209 [Arapaima gigas]
MHRSGDVTRILPDRRGWGDASYPPGVVGPVSATAAQLCRSGLQGLTLLGRVRHHQRREPETQHPPQVPPAAGPGGQGVPVSREI